MSKSDEEKAADELLLWRLLAGYHVDGEGREIKKDPLEHDSFEEKRARAVLAQQLRDGTLGYTLRELLALAIAPQIASPTRPDLRPIRKIEFKNFRPGPPSTWERDRAVIAFIKQRLRENRDNPAWKSDEPAIADACERYDLERSRVWEIWIEWLKLAKSPPSAK